MCLIWSAVAHLISVWCHPGPGGGQLPPDIGIEALTGSMHSPLHCPTSTCRERRSTSDSRFSLDQLNFQLPVFGPELSTTNHLLKQPPRMPSHFCLRYTHRRQRRKGGRGKTNIAKPGYGNIVGHSDPVVQHCTQAGDGYRVTRVKYGIGLPHIATAARLGADLAEIVTYDQRMAAAARSMGYKVSSPT